VVTLGCVLALIVAGAMLAGCGSSKSHRPVVVIMLENKTYDYVLNNPQAPFLNSMMKRGHLFTNYTGTPNSIKNYLLMTAGDRNVVANALAPPVDAPNLFTALGTGHTWRSYEESMPWPCYQGLGWGTVKGNVDGLYKKGHNPAVFFTGVTGSSLCKNVVPLNRDFDPAALPDFSLVVPNTCNQMHSMPADAVCPMWNGSVNHGYNSLQLGDHWLAAFIPQVASRATVILTFDEGSNENEHIVTVEYGKGVTPGTDATPYGHANLEAGLYRRFGLGPAPAAGATAAPLPIP
jgi:hypothetical protein